MVPKFSLSEEERELLQGFTQSDAWRALDKCMTYLLADFRDRVLAEDAQSAKLSSFKSEYDGARKLQIAIQGIKKTLKARD
jgi:hypothetical protein